MVKLFTPSEKILIDMNDSIEIKEVILNSFKNPFMFICQFLLIVLFFNFLITLTPLSSFIFNIYFILYLAISHSMYYSYYGLDIITMFFELLRGRNVILYLDEENDTILRNYYLKNVDDGMCPHLTPRIWSIKNDEYYIEFKLST